MKTTLLLILALFLGCGSRVAETPETKATEADASVVPAKPAYDSTLATKLGADEYGMKAYVLVFLKAGAKEASDSLTPERNQELMKAHLNHLATQAREGKMLVAGPMMAQAPMSGICIYDCPLEEAKMRAEADPRVIAGQLVVECYPWYGSAAMSMIPEVSDKITKKSVMDLF